MTTPAEFFLNVPLYAPVPVDLSSSSGDPLLNLAYRDLNFDGHCAACGQTTTYSRTGSPVSRYGQPGNSGRPPDSLHGIGYIGTSVTCARDPEHKLRVWFYADDKAQTFVKVGQDPSLADIANDEARVFDKQLEPVDQEELHRAIGLAAHGIGIGSFAYLRRVFERLLKRSFDLNKVRNAWSEKDWSDRRVRERLQLMSSVLPDFLNETPALYGILSKGLHELSEDECSATFPVLKFAIVEILEDEKRSLERRRLRDDAAKHIAKLKTSHDSKSS